MFTEMEFVDQVKLVSNLMSYLQVFAFSWIFVHAIKLSFIKNTEKNITIFQFIEIFSINLIILTISWLLIVVAGDFIIASLMVNLNYFEYLRKGLNTSINSSCFGSWSSCATIQDYMSQFTLSSFIRNYHTLDSPIRFTIVSLFIFISPLILKEDNLERTKPDNSVFLHIFFAIVFSYLIYPNFSHYSVPNSEDKILLIISFSIIVISFLIGFISVFIRLLRNNKP